MPLVLFALVDFTLKLSNSFIFRIKYLLVVIGFVWIGHLTPGLSVGTDGIIVVVVGYLYWLLELKVK